MSNCVSLTAIPLVEPSANVGALLGRVGIDGAIFTVGNSQMNYALPNAGSFWDKGTSEYLVEGAGDVFSRGTFEYNIIS